MQGTELLQDPEFAKTLEQSPFQAKDLPNITTAVADSFERMSPEMRQELKKALDELDDLSAEELQSFLRMIDYVEKNPREYPKLMKQLVDSGAFEPGDVPQQYDPNLMGVVKALVGQALMRVQGSAKPQGFAEGGIASLQKQAKNVAAAGREGDTVLAHINPFEAGVLKRMGGKGSINPKTGLPEFGFFSSLGNIFKIGAQIVATAALSWFVGPIAAGAIVGGATSLLSGGKPADALKSALIGGALGGLSAGVSSSLSGGSFTEGAFAGGSVFGDKPYETFLSRALSGTSVGDSLFKTPGGTATASEAAATGANLTSENARAAAEAGYGPAGTKAAVDAGLKPTVPPSSASSLFSKEGLADIWGKYKIPIMLGGGAALIGLSQSQKENIKPSMIKGPTGSELLAKEPGTYGFNPANFAQITPASPTPVFPGGNYVAPTVPASYAPVFDYGKVRYPTAGIMNAKVGGHINGPGNGTSDSIPARLSDGEFVMTAKAVRGAGQGDRMKGARKMYELMHKFERMA